MFTITPQATFDVSVWARGEIETSGDAGTVSVVFTNSQGTEISTETATTITSSQLTTTWTQYFGQVTAPGGAVQAQVVLASTETTGWVTFDDVTMVDTNTTTPASETVYYTLGGAVAAKRTDGMFSHVLTDHLGSPHTVWTPSTGDIDRQLYEPWGGVRYSEDLGTDVGYTGQRLDDTGLMFYQARYYDPVVGRFISADSIVPNPTNPQDLNRYSYVRNNPYSYTDPTGHFRRNMIDGGGGLRLTQEQLFAEAYGQVMYWGDSAGVERDLLEKGSFMPGVDVAADVGLCGSSLGGGNWGSAAFDCSMAALPGLGVGPMKWLLKKIPGLDKVFKKWDNATNTARPSAFSRTESLSGNASSRQVAEMTESMRVSGWQGPPIKVVEVDGRLYVVDGHHRLAAARQAGIDVPYEVVDPRTVIGPGQWSSIDSILRDSATVGPDRLRR